MTYIVFNREGKKKKPPNKKGENHDHRYHRY